MTKSSAWTLGRPRLATWLPVLTVLTTLTCKSPQRTTPTPTIATADERTTEGSDAAVVVADPAWLATKTPLDPKIRRGVLPNGLTYYLVQNPKPAKRASLWLAINAGSVLEDDDQRGLAHFVEHMAFNGTANFPKHKIIETIEQFGMKFGADLNAYTSFDQTVYQLKVPTDDAAHVGKALDILRDWAGGIAFDAKEIEAERGVVLEEWRLSQGAQMRLAEKQLPLLLRGSKFAERLPIGLPDTIKTAPREAFLRFYKDWYRPDLMAVIVVGDLDLDKAEAEIKARFASLAGPTKSRPRPLERVPLDHATLVSRLSDKEMPMSMISVSDKTPAPGEETVGDYRDYVIDALATMIISERFTELAKAADSPFLMPPAIGTNEIVRDATSTTRMAVVKNGRTLDGLKILMTENARVAQHGFLATELARAKKEFLSTYVQMTKETDSRDSADVAAELTRNYFEGEQMPGRAAELALVEALLPTIGLTDLNQRARQLAVARGRIISIVTPKEGDLPPEAEIVKTVAAAEQSVEKREEVAITGKILETPPTPGTIIAERVDEALGITEWKLSNGATVVLRPTDFDADTILLSGFAKGGYSLASDATYWSAQASAAMVNVSGVGTLSKADLDKLSAGRRAVAITEMDEFSQRVFGNASVADFELMLQILHAKIAAPRRDPVAIATWQQMQIGLAKENNASPEQKFEDQVREAHYGNNLRKRDAEPADLEAISIDDAFAFYRERFADLSDFTFVLTGKLDLPTTRLLVMKYLASLPGSATSPRVGTWKDPNLPRRPGKHSKTVHAGSEPKSQVVLSTWLPATWTLATATDAKILRMALGMRLIDVLREEMSGVYGARANVTLSRIPRQELRLDINFGCAPENVAALQKAARAELAAIAKNGVEPAYLERIVAQLRREREENLSVNRWWLSSIAQAYEYGDALPALLDIEATVARVTNGNIKAMAKRLVASKNQFTGVLMPAK